jgi:protoheme IX farnesyltransferase
MADALKAADAGDPVTLAAPAEHARAWADFVTLTKPRVNVLVIVTTLVGLYLGSDAQLSLGGLVHTVLGTFLVASGAAAFNQVIERDVDGRMRRTAMRPLPAGRVGVIHATWFAALLSAVGLAELAVGANLLAAAVALATLASYALVYTPLKRYTSLSTVVGAVPGALPPMIGWAAARGTLGIEAWTLFAIVFFWQMPHVLAISWIHRDDYARGGIRVLPVVEPDGASTARQMISYSAATIPASLLPTLVGLAGGLYFTGAFLLGLMMLALSVDFARHRSITRARRLFFASLVYLPAVLILLVVDRTP